MKERIHMKLIQKYNIIYNLPAINMFEENNEKLDDLHTKIELLMRDIVGFVDSYLKTKKIKWTEKELKKEIKSLKEKIKDIDVRKIKEKSLFNQYKKYSNLLINLMRLMIKILHK